MFRRHSGIDPAWVFVFEGGRVSHQENRRIEARLQEDVW